MKTRAVAMGILREDRVQRLQPLQFGEPLLSGAVVQDHRLTILNLTKYELASCDAQRNLNRIDLVEYLFTGLARFCHFDQNVQVSCRATQLPGDFKPLIGFHEPPRWGNGFWKTVRSARAGSPSPHAG